jgi:hypothetical protein
MSLIHESLTAVYHNKYADFILSLKHKSLTVVYYNKYVDFDIDIDIHVYASMAAVI